MTAVEHRLGAHVKAGTHTIGFWCLMTLKKVHLSRQNRPKQRTTCAVSAADIFKGCFQQRQSAPHVLPKHVVPTVYCLHFPHWKNNFFPPVFSVGFCLVKMAFFLSTKWEQQSWFILLRSALEICSERMCPAFYFFCWDTSFQSGETSEMSQVSSLFKLQSSNKSYLY